MSIDLYTVPGEEFALAWAVEGMTFDWALSDAASTQKAHEALTHYGFGSIVDGKYQTNDQQSSVAFNLEGRDKLLNTHKYWGKVSIDRKHLNVRSNYLLTLLAKLSNEYLVSGDGNMWHGSMQAGQAAWGELLTYGLIYVDRQSGGRWTEAGLEVLDAFPDLGAFPR